MLYPPLWSTIPSFPSILNNSMCSFIMYILKNTFKTIKFPFSYKQLLKRVGQHVKQPQEQISSSKIVQFRESVFHRITVRRPQYIRILLDHFVK